MIVDSSAVVAILFGEPESDAFVAAMRSTRARMSAVAYLEVGIVVDNRNAPAASRRLDPLLAELGVEVVGLTPAQARTARAAYRDFGRGSGHPARLNFGDCCSYALAIDTDEPLLFKGNDFGHTDVQIAEWQ